MFRVSSEIPFSRTFISIYVAAGNITEYDVWWIDNPIFNYNPHAVLYQRDVHKTKSLFEIRIQHIEYQSRCQTVWHLRKFIGDIGIRALDITTQVIVMAYKGYRPVLSSFTSHSNLHVFRYDVWYRNRDSLYICPNRCKNLGVNHFYRILLRKLRRDFHRLQITTVNH